MASDQYTVKASIVMDTAGFEQAMTRAGRKVKSFGQQATRVGRDLTTAVSGPLLLVTAAAIKTAASFDLAQRKIQALNPKGNIDKLTKSARELGASTIFTAEQVSQLQLSLAKLGKSDKEIAAIQGTVLKFAQAMDQDLATSGEFLVKTMNRYADSLKEVGNQTEQAAYVGNLFASVAANTALDATNLANALNYVGSEAAVYGLTLEDTSVILGLLADRGFDASRGGTALRRILAQLAKDGYSAGEAIEQLLDPTKGFSAELEQFGLRGAGPAAALGGLRLEFDELKATISDSSGFLNEFALILDNSITASFKRVKSAAEEVSISFTSDFSGAIKTANTNIANLLRSFSALPKPIKGVIVGLGAFLAIAGPLLLITGALASAIGALMVSTAGLAGILTGGVVVAIGAAAAAIFLLTENADAASMSVGELRRKLYESNEELRDVAKLEYVDKKELETLVTFQTEIERVTKKIERLQRSNVGSSYSRQIKNLTSDLNDLKSQQSDYADQVERAAKARREERIEAEKFAKETAPLFFAAFPGEGEGGGKSTEEIDSRSKNDLLQERLELLRRQNLLIAQAKSKGGEGVFDQDQLRSVNAEIKDIETSLNLLGITFSKTKKKTKDPEFLNDVLGEFEANNFGTDVFGPIFYRSPLVAIENDVLRANEALRVLNNLQKDNNIVTARQALTQAGVSDAAKLTRKELTALTNYYQSILARKKNDDFDGALFMFGRGEDSKIDFDSTHKAVDDLIDAGNDMSRGFKQAALELESFVLAITTGLADMLGNALRNSIEGTKSFAESLKEDLVNALQRVLVKVLALIAAFAILNLLSGGTGKVASLATNALGNKNLFQYVGSGFLGSRSAQGNLRVEGVLSGSDVVLGTRRGATALDRIYG